MSPGFQKLQIYERLSCFSCHDLPRHIKNMNPQNLSLSNFCQCMKLNIQIKTAKFMVTIK